MIKALEENFSDESSWFKKKSIKGIYYFYVKLLKLVASDRHFTTKCVQCQIEFITTKSNQNRSDMRCRFGCRKQYRKKKSNERVKNYYNTPEGREKKKRLNQQRSEGQRGSTPPSLPPTKDRTRPPSEINLYIQTILKATGHNASIKEIELMAADAEKKLRQHPLEKIIKMIKVGGYG